MACKPARSDIYEEVVNAELVKNLIARADTTFPVQSDAANRLTNPLWVQGLKVIYRDKNEHSILWYDEQNKLTGLLEYNNGVLKDSIMFYPNGQRMFTLLMDKNGKASGPARYYHPDGRVSASGSFEKGKKTGIWREFKTDGRLEITREYDKYGNSKR